LNTYQQLEVENTTWYYPSLPAAIGNPETLNNLPYALRTLLLNLIQNDSNDAENDINAIIDWPMMRSDGQNAAFITNHLVLQEQRSSAALQCLNSLLQQLPEQTATTPGIRLDVMKADSAQSERLKQLARSLSNLQISSEPPGQPSLIDTYREGERQVIRAAAIAGSPQMRASGLYSPRLCALSATGPLLGTPLSMAPTDVTGIELLGTTPDNLSPQQLATAICQQLQEQPLQGLLEFYGPGLETLPLSCRSAISLHLSSQGLSAFFPLDQQSLAHQDSQAALTEAWGRAQKIWYDQTQPAPTYSEKCSLDLSTLCKSDADAENIGDITERTETRYSLQEQPARDLKNGRIQALLSNNSAPIPSTDASDDRANIIFAGNNYGDDSAADLLTLAHMSAGTSAIICSSFSALQRSSLANAGILPLEFIEGDSWQALQLTGDERIELDIPDEIYPYEPVVMLVHRENGRRELVELTLRLDTAHEIKTYMAGGLFPYLIRQLNEARSTMHPIQS